MIAALARILARRSKRERTLLTLLALGAVPVAFVGLIALPLIDARDAARAELDAARATRDWYAARQVEIAVLPALDTAEPEAEPPAPVGLGGIEAGLIAADLRNVVSQLANAPDRGVRLSFAAAPFAGVMDWVDGLAEGSGYSVAALVLERVSPGLVDADIRLEPLR
ncbi:type II secretion system protein M [Rhodobacter sp. NTK016B]|uniref:type II secretion system protein GspM n=1 Tax=Rhodobacter sp. NTK016B TaxID=2759676 RepID=UPI001A8FEA77|nr:type II secretion system protein GspM [Rhodobacter sp. NTK016B]MBN8292964.1 type II secretion system protein M [Rhodobacter sp. NTK016B]